MLFGHRWADKTRPHNLLADWSQEEKKKQQHVYREKDEKKKKTAHMGTEIFMYKLMCN